MELQKYSSPSDTFKNMVGQLPKNYHYVIIFHLSHNNLGYLLEWVQNVPVLGVISIPYSEHADMKAAVAQHTTVYSPALDQIPNSLIDICTQNIDKEIILVEIGGYSAAIAHYLPNVVLAIEDTARGHEEYKRHETSLTYPVVSIARTSGRQKEDDAVGRAIAESTTKVLEMLGQEPSRMNVAVLGYGGVGRAAASYLRKITGSVDAYDPAVARMELVRGDGFEGAARTELLSEADVIVGCSGHQSLTIEDIPLLKDDAVLISGSSRQVEFPYEALQEMALDSSEDGIIGELTIHDKSFKLIYRGQPINFYFDISLGEVFDIPMTLLAQAVIYGTSQKLSPGLYSLPENS